MFAHNGPTTSTTGDIFEMDCRFTGISSNTYTITLNPSQMVTTLPPKGMGGNVITRYRPPEPEDPRERALWKKAQKRKNKLSRPAWRR